MTTFVQGTPMKITFGVPSLKKPTPQIATTVATVILYAAGVINLVFLSFPSIPTPIKTVVGEYSASGVAFVHAICNMFGLTPQNPSSPSK